MCIVLPIRNRVGAAVLATDGIAYAKNGSVTIDAAGGAGLFAYGGGTLYGWDLNEETNDESSAWVEKDCYLAKIICRGNSPFLYGNKINHLLGRWRK